MAVEPATASAAAKKSPPQRVAEEEVLAELLHELRSLLSLILVCEGESGALAAALAAGRRMAYLLDYAAATRSAGLLPRRPLPVAAEIQKAAGALQECQVLQAEIIAALPQQLILPLPAEERPRLLLLMAWLETASYGAPLCPLVVSAVQLGGLIELTASSAGRVERDPERLRQRLCTRAAAALAACCAGRLVVAAGRPQAMLLLPMA
jgi:hypothetical protein